MSSPAMELMVASGVTRATVARIADRGTVKVRWGTGRPASSLECDVLEQSTGAALVLRVGDEVLVHVPEDPGARGCILGKVGPYREPDRKRVEISADEEVVIRCGPGLIVIRKSGRVLLKGLEIVSHAKGRNRVRGGSIQLN